MKSTYLIFGLLLIAMVYSQCPVGCANCTTPTSCSRCAPGNFLVNSTNCPRCPEGCTACTADSNFRPLCSACAAPAQLNVSNSRCFVCDPSCVTCNLNPRNCTSCRDGSQLLSDSNGVGYCGALRNCAIPNCG